MDNTTTLTFTMAAYVVMENYKYWMFTMFLLLYLVIILLNVLLISVIQQNKELHNPMTAFPFVLSVNELYGTTALLPTIMALLLAKTHEISVKWCMAQVYFLHTYASMELSILALMGYDRYVAICRPLHYHCLMSHSKAGKLIAFAAIYPVVMFGLFYSLTTRLSFCGKVVHKLYCVNMELVKTSCYAASYISVIGLVLILFLVIPQVLMIAFSYARIFRVCRKMPRQSQRNALKTCVPHLISLITYTIGCLFEIVQNRFDMGHVAVEVQIFLSLYFVLIPPITNPVLYGLGTQSVRVQILKLLLKYKTLPTLFAKAVTLASL